MSHFFSIRSTCLHFVIVFQMNCAHLWCLSRFVMLTLWLQGIRYFWIGPLCHQDPTLVAWTKTKYCFQFRHSHMSNINMTVRISLIREHQSVWHFIIIIPTNNWRINPYTQTVDIVAFCAEGAAHCLNLLCLNLWDFHICCTRAKAF